MRPGESFATFSLRLKKEANDMLIEENKKKSRKMEKRKEFRAKKKEKLLKKRKRDEGEDDFGADADQEDNKDGYGRSESNSGRARGRPGVDSDDEERRPPNRSSVTHFAQLRDEVKFGEQANEPPKFNRLPRGAKPTTKRAKTATIAAQMLQKPKLNPVEQRQMDLLRERIRNQLSGSQKPAPKLSMHG